LREDLDVPVVEDEDGAIAADHERTVRKRRHAEEVLCRDVGRADLSRLLVADEDGAEEADGVGGIRRACDVRKRPPRAVDLLPSPMPAAARTEGATGAAGTRQLTRPSLRAA